MKNKAVSGIMLTLLLTITLTLALYVQLIEAAGTIYITANGKVDPPTAPIQRDKDVYTFTDNIYDSIVVERDNIVIDGAGYAVQGTGSGIGIDITGRSSVTIMNVEIITFNYGIYLWGSSNNSISGNNITNNRWGVRLSESSNNSISGNNITNNSYGIWLEHSSNHNTIYGNILNNRFVGIEIRYSSNHNSLSDNHIRAHDWQGIMVEHSASYNRISGNNVRENKKFGILLAYSSNNSISGNDLIDNYYGIALDGSSNNTLRGNSMVNNKNNFRVMGWSGLLDFVNDVDVSNTVDGKPVYYWVNKLDMAVPPDAGYVALVNCTSIAVQNLNLTNNGQGALLAYTTNSTITRNKILSNQYGIHFVHSSSNLISGNIITNNHRGILFEISSSNNNVVAGNIVSKSSVAVWLERSSNNKLYHNNFIDNADQVHSTYSGYANVWDDGYPPGGNCWSDYMYVDLFSGPGQDVPGSDGIWDHPYIIDANNQDRYPLVKPWTPTPGDVNGDGTVDASDLFDLNKAYGCVLGDANWDGRCDFNEDNKVDASDLFDLSKNYGKTM